MDKIAEGLPYVTPDAPLVSDQQLIETQDQSQYVTFSVNGDEYGVEILAIQEIKAWSETTPLPNSPEFMRGVLNLRGLIVPIYDLKCRFGRGLTEVTPMHVIIIIRVEDRLAGILVDAVSDIIDVLFSQIHPLPELDNTIDGSFFKGLANMDGRMVAILDIKALFAKSTDALNKPEALEAKTMIANASDEGVGGE